MRYDNIPYQAVYVGRPSKWGNPYQSGVHGTRDEVIRLYENYLLTSNDLLDSLEELTGKDLVCWCKPKACHGDILLVYANDLEKELKSLQDTLF
jgi:hypothetical protein